jgi:ABC-type sulfate transport system permease component
MNSAVEHLLMNKRSFVMKKVIGIVLAMMFVSVALTGCYSRACDQPAPSYKGEVK